MNNSPNVVFEKDGYVCEAYVYYMKPQSQTMNSDVDYHGGYFIDDMFVYKDDELTEDHPITRRDVILQYEINREFHGSYDEADEYYWED